MPCRLAGQRNDPFVCAETLFVQVNLPIVVVVKAVMSVRMYAGKPVQCASLKNEADRFGVAVLVELGVAAHRPFTDAGIGAERTPGWRAGLPVVRTSQDCQRGDQHNCISKSGPSTIHGGLLFAFAAFQQVLVSCR